MWSRIAQSLTAICAPRLRGVRVLGYHGIAERLDDPLLERNFHRLAEFRAHVRFLERARILTLAELADHVASGRRPPEPAAIITFDDGYANNRLAHEVLAAARLPFAVFVSTGAIGPGRAIWTVELSLLLLHGRAESVELLERRWSLTGRPAREHAFQTIRRALKALSAAPCRTAMEQLRQQFPAGETARLLERFPSMRALTWPEVAQLAAAGADVGSHGVHDELHHATQAPAVRAAELVESKAELERRLGRPCRYFAFPNGDVHPGSADEVRAADYALGFTTQPGTVRPGTGQSPYLLPRVDSAAGGGRLRAGVRPGPAGSGRPVRGRLAEVRLGLAHARALLAPRITPEQALAAVRNRLAARAAAFLETMERAVFAHDGSPYRPLLLAAGIDLARLRSMVGTHGVEGTLARLSAAGVYVTIDEFKGRREARRGDRVFRFSERDFRNPLIGPGLTAASGGTRTGAIESTISPGNHRMGAEHLALARAAYGIERRPTAVWLTQSHGASLWAVLALAAINRGRVRWFTRLPSPPARGPRPLARRAIAACAWAHGVRLPRPRHVPFGREAEILATMQRAAPRGYGVFTTPSSALRLALAARRDRRSLAGVTFVTVAEPLTPAKLAAITAAGARAYSSLGFTEFGRATYGCARASSADDTHLCTDAIAVVQRRRPVDRFGSELDALLFTSLQPDARRILLNMETGDYATVRSGRCGCLLETAGWTVRLADIRSFEKLNAEGRLFMGGDIVALVEETLPGRFGGDPTDYQLVEQEDADGFTRLQVLVHPRLGPVDEAAVLACVEERLAAAQRAAATVWKEAGTVRLRRAPPILTGAGKLMPLHHLGPERPPR